MSATVVPERSAAKRLEALERATYVRISRAELKRELKAGRVRFADLLRDPPEFIETMKVFDLMLAIRLVGREKASLAFHRIRISPTKTVAGLTERQRDELIRYLGKRA